MPQPHRPATHLPASGSAAASAFAPAFEEHGRPAVLFKRDRTLLQQAAVRFGEPSQASEAAQYLDEFHMAFEPLVDAMETELTPMLRGAGASEGLMHEWSLTVAALQDFLPELADEIRRTREE